MLALPIIPGRLQPSIVGRSELNYRVRNGNGWTLTLINTNFVDASFISLASAFDESSLIPLRLLFHSDPLRWALNGLHLVYYQKLFRLSRKTLVTRTGFEPMLTA